MAKNIVITGANRGIGLELVKHYLKQGHQVWGVCRQASEALEASGAQVVDKVDVATEAGISRLLDLLSDVPVDLLINNAGVLRGDNIDTVNPDHVRLQYEVNAVAPLRVTLALRPQLRKGGRVGMVTSRMGSIADNTSGGQYGYRMSKAALNAAAKSLAHDLASDDISVGIVHPGFVQTDMVGGAGDISPQIAAQRIADRLDELNQDNTGTFWHSKGDVLPW